MSTRMPESEAEWMGYHEIGEPDPPCLILDAGAQVDPLPAAESPFAGGRRAWECPRCAQVFSERHPTSLDGTCQFDET